MICSDSLWQHFILTATACSGIPQASPNSLSLLCNIARLRRKRPLWVRVLYKSGISCSDSANLPPAPELEFSLTQLTMSAKSPSTQASLDSLQRVPRSSRLAVESQRTSSPCHSVQKTHPIATCTPYSYSS